MRSTDSGVSLPLMSKSGCARKWVTPRLAQERDQVVHVRARLVGRREGRLVDPQRDDVHAYAVLREPAVELGAQERARQVGDRQRSGQRVVVGDGDEVHASRALGMVQLHGVGERLRAAERADAGVARGRPSAWSGRGGRL